MLKARVNVCLGTDSLARVCKTWRQTVELNMFDEMRALAQREPWLSVRKILRMATINGAQALGRQRQIGELSQGALADLIAVPFKGKTAYSYEVVMHPKGDVAASMDDGEWTIPPRK